MLHNFYGWREELETCTAPVYDLDYARAGLPCSYGFRSLSCCCTSCITHITGQCDFACFSFFFFNYTSVAVYRAKHRKLK